MPDVRSFSVRTCAAPAPFAQVRSPLFSQRLAGHLVLEHRLGKELLETPVLGLQLLQALGVGHTHAAEVAPPQVVRRLAEAVPATQLLDRQSGLDLTQEADDLLYVQSP